MTPRRHLAPLLVTLVAVAVLLVLGVWAVLAIWVGGML